MVITKAQLQKVHNVAMECIKHLVIAKGVSVNQAEDMVLQTLKESEAYMKAGMINETIASLKMIHMDQSVDRAAKELLKSLSK
jgi:hypothetical protein